MIAIIEIDCDIFISIIFLHNVFCFVTRNGLVLDYDRIFKTEQ